MEQRFDVTMLPYGVLGIDFLSKFNLFLDTARRRLKEYQEVERFSEDAADSPDSYNISNLTRPDKSYGLLFQKLNSEFPEVLRAVANPNS